MNGSNQSPSWALAVLLLLGCCAIGTVQAAPEDIERLGKD
jgi:hypothetical protein